MEESKKESLKIEYSLKPMRHQVKYDSIAAWFKSLSGLFTVSESQHSFVIMLMYLLWKENRIKPNKKIRDTLHSHFDYKAEDSVYRIMIKMKKGGVITDDGTIHPLLQFVDKDGKRVGVKQILITYIDPNRG